ncbi:MAG: NAD(P)H-dependent oxidoreductase [Chloroflexi bacterium]|nr:NAD(P)H-dependent oxidoreductase [Chloroflexota bacterium]
MPNPAHILILYAPDKKMVNDLAQATAEGAQSVKRAEVSLQTPKRTTKADLVAADALIIGTPNWTGIKGSLKLYLDNTGDLWEEHVLAGKVGAAFTASDGRHSGTEFTLLTVLHWMLGNGMVIVGLPWTPVMARSGSYYGATAAGEITAEDLDQGRALGRRVAEYTVRLKK